MVKNRLLAAGAVLAMVVMACSSSATPSPAPASAAPATQAPASQAPASMAPATVAPATVAPSATAAAGTPKDGGTLVVALPGDMVLADPTLTSDSNSSYVQQNVIQSLVGLKPGTLDTVIPVLAESLPTVSADGLTYTFKIRQGVTFHDGTPLDAAAVVYNYQRQKDMPKSLQDAYNYYFGVVFGGFGDKSNLKSITAPDASTVVMTLGTPQSTFLLTQILPQFGIQSPTALKAGDSSNPDPSKSPYAQGQGGLGKSMVGTGPFMFKEWVPNDHVTIVKNPTYFDPAGMAHLDAITYRPMSDTTARLNALQAGDVDFTQQIAPNDVATAQADSTLQVYDRGSSCNILNLGLNHSVKPFDNLQLRQAIAYALNRQSYVDAFYSGQAIMADNWMPPGFFSYKALGLPTFDLAKAKSLVAASGVPADQLNLTLWYPSNVTRPYMPDPKGEAEAVARDLEAAGFKITFKTEPWATYIPDFQSGKLPMFLSGWTCDWAAPDNFLIAWAFGFQGGKPNAQFNYGPPELKTAFDTAMAASTDAAAATAWGQAQDILAKDLPTVPLVSSKNAAAAKADVMGFVPAGNLTELMNTVWLNR